MTHNGRLPKIDGTKKLVHKNKLLVSLGLPALDLIIGGGLPMGNIFLLEEDEYGIFSNVVVKHYLAEGVISKHATVIASLDTDCEKLVNDLPSPMNAPVNTFVDDDEVVKKNGELRIAWRYGNSSSPNQTSDRSKPIFGHTFDLNSRLIISLNGKSEISYWVHSEIDTNVYNYNTLYEYVVKMLENPRYNCNLPSENRTVLRIALLNLATGLWTGNLFVFLIKLRILLRNYCATCLITIQPKVLENAKDLSRIEHLCDTVIELKSLLNDGNPSYADYDGLVILKKLPHVNSWAPIVPETNDWAFKLKRNRFIIETLHISPELKMPETKKGDENGCGKMTQCVSEQF